MNLLRTLLAKDLRRARRNPVPWLILLVMPFSVVALIGMAFGPQTGGGLAAIKLAIVDEDDSPLSEFIRNAFNQNHAEQPVQFQAEVLERDAAVARVTNNEFSAAIILPAGFMQDYLDGDKPVRLELIKNPAQGIPPVILEEAIATLVALLNAPQRILGDDLQEWRGLLEGEEDFDLLTVGALLIEAGESLAVAREYLFPPLVTFTEKTRVDESAPAGPSGDMFGYLLIGMAAMFLLFMADQAMRDLYREMRFRTLLRFRTLRAGLALFIGAKVLFAMTTLVAGGLVLLGGGALIFQFNWPQPLALAGLTLAYAVFAAGLMGLIAALAGAERRADGLNTVTAMVLSIAGGCMFPPESFPPFLRDGITPLTPTGWFAEAGRDLMWNEPHMGTLVAALKLTALGVVCIMAAAWLFRLRLEKGATVTP